jgi:DNA-binding cell septation regulator SpoVG
MGQQISIKRMRTMGTTGKLKAFFTAEIGELIVDDLRLIHGRNGPFVGFPSKKVTFKDGREEYVDIVRPLKDDEGKYLNPEFMETLTKVAIEEYERRTKESLSDNNEDDDLPF